MTREELSEIDKMKKELRMWEERIAELRSKSLTGSKQVDGMPFANTNDVSDTTFQYISQIMEMQAVIDEHRLKIEHKIYEIEKYIITLDDSFLRQIIEYRCIQGKQWEQVAMMIGCGSSGESCRKYFNRRYPQK